MLKFLSRTLASLLVAVALVAIGSLIFNQTLLSSKYLQGQLKEADAYNRLSVALSKEVAKQANVENDQAIATVQQVITPEVLQQRLDAALVQMEAYYKGDGPPPQIEVGDLITQAQAAGIPISSDAEATKPIVLAPRSQDKPPTGTLYNLKLLPALLAVVLIAILAFISWKTKRYKILPNVAISCGAFLLLIGLVLIFGSGVFDHFVKLDTTSNAFAGIAHDLAKNITHDLGKRYAIIAAILLVIGIGSRVVLGKLHIHTTKNIAK